MVLGISGEYHFLRSYINLQALILHHWLNKGKRWHVNSRICQRSQQFQLEQNQIRPKFTIYSDIYTYRCTENFSMSFEIF